MERYYIGSPHAIKAAEEREWYVNTISNLQKALFSSKKAIFQQVNSEVDNAIRCYFPDLEDHKDRWLISMRGKQSIYNYIEDHLSTRDSDFWQFFFWEFSYQFSYEISYEKSYWKRAYGNEEVNYDYESILVNAFTNAVGNIENLYEEYKKLNFSGVINEVKEVDLGLN